VDFSKGPDGLAGLVRNAGSDPLNGSIYVFRAKQADQVKLVWWDGTKLCLYAKWLEKAKVCRPRLEESRVRLSHAQLLALVDGMDWTKVRGRVRAVSNRLGKACGGVTQGTERPRNPDSDVCSVAGMRTLAERDLPDDVEALKALLLAKQAETEQLHAEIVERKAIKAGDGLKIANLTSIITIRQRAQFGTRSEKLRSILGFPLVDARIAHAMLAA